MVHIERRHLLECNQCHILTSRNAMKCPKCNSAKLTERIYYPIVDETDTELLSKQAQDRHWKDYEEWNKKFG